jgi:hypothetical protein
VIGESKGINEVKAASSCTLAFADQETTAIGAVFLISAIVAGIKFPSAQLNPQI